MNSKKSEKTESPFGENTTLTLIIKRADHESAYQKELARLATNLQLTGFRKGKAPLKLVRDYVGHEALIRQVISTLTPALFQSECERLHILPLVAPQITIKSVEPDTDWTVEAVTAQAPVINLGDWKSIARQAKVEHAKTKGKEPLQSTILGALIQAIKPKIAPLLFESELSHSLEHFARELAAHRLDLETYIKQTGKTIAQIRAEYASIALANLQLEFILQALTNTFDPQVDEQEDDARNLLKRQKVLTMLESL